MESCKLCHEAILNFVCKSHTGMCQECYKQEVFEELKGKPMLAMQFIHTLPPVLRFEPAMNNGTDHTEFGLCDECGEVSDMLVKFNNKWICEDCKEEKP